MGYALSEFDLSVFPDITVRCGPREAGTDVIANPLVVVEVLSPSTRQKDRNEKARAYRRIPSLEQYMLIEQKIPLVEVYRRSGGEWSFEEFDKKADVIDFPSLNYRIALGDIYEGVAEVEF